MEGRENRRQSLRYVRHDRLFVQILTASEPQDISSRTLLCHNCDASVNGMRIELEQEVPIHSLVDLWASFEGLDEKYYLRGEVCWCYELGGECPSFQIGVELVDAFATDYRRWVELINSFSREYRPALS